MFDLILKNGTVVTQTIDCKNLHILPGVIDTHVHFREPGLTHKEDFATGTLSAIAGGVTTIFEMPNTDPLTITADTLQDKLQMAKGRAWCDYAFFIGGSADNADNLDVLEKMPGCCGVKIYMGSSTGSLLTAEDNIILSILKKGIRHVAIHAEDEERLKSRKHIAEASHDVKDHPNWRDAETALMASKRAVRLAREAGRPIHLLHITSADEMAFLSNHKDIATIEVTPHHLTLSAPECYKNIGTLAQINPPIRDKHHQEALWQAVRNGLVDTIGSDHAPHTLDEKNKSYPASPSGIPGVQTTLPIMLNHVNKGRLSLLRLADLLAHRPQCLYQIAGKGRIAVGYDADFAVVDLHKSSTITNKWIKSKCGWTPYNDMTVTGWVQGTILRGSLVMWEDEILESPKGRKVILGN